MHPVLFRMPTHPALAPVSCIRYTSRRIGDARPTRKGRGQDRLPRGAKLRPGDEAQASKRLYHYVGGGPLDATSALVLRSGMTDWHWPERKETEAVWLARRQGMHPSSRIETFGPGWRVRLRCACNHEVEVKVRELGRTGASDIEVRTLGRFIERDRCRACGSKPASAFLTGAIHGTEIELIGTPARWWR